MAEWNDTPPIIPRRKLPFESNPERDINILLLSETGVGKSTFINAFANYLVHDTLNAALQGDMKVLIPATFSVADEDTHTPTLITVATRDNNELCEDNGKSQIQRCKSYLFPIGDRYLRLIDTPGVGDCRGVEQDNSNFQHILAFISRYEHLNGICILFRPNDNRLNVSFRYTVKEVLNHLHINAKDNIMFVFTNARTSFYMPGATSTQLRLLLNELAVNTHIYVPFERENTFLFDNEAFRFLAVRKAEHHFWDEHKPAFIDSWNKAVAELSGLIGRIVECKVHTVREMQSLNAAQQMIHKLPRPIGEVAKLIQENIQLAEQHKKKVSANARDIKPNQVPEKTATVILIKYPRTICTSKKCSEA